MVFNASSYSFYGGDFTGTRITVRQSVRYGYLIGCLTALVSGFQSMYFIHLLVLASTKWMAHVTYQNSRGNLLLGWQCLRSQPNTNIEINGTVIHRVYLKLLQWVFLQKPQSHYLFSGNFYDDCKYPMKVQVFYGVWMCMVNAIWWWVYCLHSLLYVNGFWSLLWAGDGGVVNWDCVKVGLFV